MAEHNNRKVGVAVSTTEKKAPAILKRRVKLQTTYVHVHYMYV